MVHVVHTPTLIHSLLPAAKQTWDRQKHQPGSFRLIIRISVIRQVHQRGSRNLTSVDVSTLHTSKIQHRFDSNSTKAGVNMHISNKNLEILRCGPQTTRMQDLNGYLYDDLSFHNVNSSTTTMAQPFLILAILLPTLGYRVYSKLSRQESNIDHWEYGRAELPLLQKM